MAPLAKTFGTTWWPGANEYIEGMLPTLNQLALSRGGEPLTRGQVKQMIAASRIGKLIRQQDVIEGVDRVARFLALADAESFYRLSRADSST